MSSKKQQSDLDLGIAAPPTAPGKLDLTIKANSDIALTPAQMEFNKRLKALEKARASLERKRANLDKDLVICREILMPLVEKRNQTQYQLIVLTYQSSKSIKLSKRRSTCLEGLLCLKMDDLLGDPAGLCEEEITTLNSIFKEIAPLDSDDPDYEDPELNEEEREAIQEEFDDMRAMVENFARQNGLELDLEGLDPHMDPAEFEMELQRRLAAAAENAEKSHTHPHAAKKRSRKPSKAALERERLRQETEEAKKRDFKTLYKQLAKVLHPDLETDPALKQHKEEWMKRLTAAHSSGDLHAMLAIEIEWLGEEAGNLKKATDEKLRVYSLVLKEQIDDLKQQAIYLSHSPEYFTLHRFLRPFDDRLNSHLFRLKLQEENNALSGMLATVRKGGAAARNFIHKTADEYARNYEF